jgi:cation diffusion facilitator CzcD-associated flavoprotein CzcO/NADP-dependent 3-hydroxy acid dehydrogenase YdfG
VLVVGAGLSGIAAGHYLQAECPWARFAIFEARDRLGGTWDLFRYPGIRSDSDMHTLGYSFRPWTGEDSIADGPDILRYLHDTVEAEGLEARIRFGHRVVRADWSSGDALWHVTAERSAEDGAVERVELTAGFVLSCAGYYRYDHGYEPAFADIDRFTGTVVHPQLWPEDLDVTGRRVVVIGSGATAITLVPALAREAAHVTMLQRSPSYIASVSRRSSVVAMIRRLLPGATAEVVLRWSYALRLHGLWEISRRRPAVVRRLLRYGVQRELPGYDLDPDFIPTYQPWDQRLCVVPDGDLFEAIRDGRASVVTDHIERFTPAGILLGSGTELEADLVVTATGLELLFFGGMDLTVDGEAVVPRERVVYKGLMLDAVPNLAFVVGYANASWTLKAEITLDYVCRLLNGMRRTGLRQCTAVNTDPVEDRIPLLPLQSGYVQRASGTFPRQGGRFPWQVHQTYWQDLSAMRRDPTEDQAMKLTNPGTKTAGTPDRFVGRVAAITGAGSGIGRCLAEQLARRGAHLALADINEAGLEETKALCEGHGVKITTERVDVADRDAVFAWAEHVVADHGKVNLVFNNAGVALITDIEPMAIKDMEWLMGINLWGVVHGTQAFLPHLTASGEGHVVNLSSVFGLLAFPGQAAYNAAKFGVRGFTDCLRMELEINDSCVSATTVHPGGIKTNIARNTRIGSNDDDPSTALRELTESFEKTAMTTPDKAAAVILRAVEQNKRRVTIGPDAKLFDLLSRLPAVVPQTVMVFGARRRFRAARPTPARNG